MIAKLLKKIQRFARSFCLHDWETVEVKAEHEIEDRRDAFDMLVQPFAGPIYCHNRVCLKCGKTDFEIDRKEKAFEIRERARLERVIKANDILSDLENK